MFDPLRFFAADPWDEWAGNWLRVPPRPQGVIHFLGGAFLATAPHLSYRSLLNAIAEAGYAIIATPFLNTFDHQAIARDVLNRFEQCYARWQALERLPPGLPIYGLGHSMGVKLHLLIGSVYTVTRAGNILLAFNNYPVERSIPLVQELNLRETLELRFTPSPQETLTLVRQDYGIAQNLLIQFRRDDIDQTVTLLPLLEAKFGSSTRWQLLPGTHLTPINQTLTWQAGDTFTPLDAIGQWFKEGINGDLETLQQQVLAELARW
ncbi:MAG: DUF1350 family protein [Cyanobacteria bacterium P01_G01_bin.54]